MASPTPPDPARGSVLTSLGEARVIRAFGGEMHYHLSGDQTEKRFLLATIIAPPGHGPPVHWHENEDECFVLQEGRLSFLTGGEWKDVGPGDIVFTPRKTIHTYKNPGATPAKMLFTALPSGFDEFFAECAVEFAKPGGPDMPRIVEISARHGIYYV
ncbi:MAG TPA: cupin domain-containing protein [Candidatus Methylacidiphilales bacterium]|jgi:mannose-6-phosphate isomerase-like protein (cupin superfamily)|nr:cupin domain-containing protein [Candidatus Methylacidiphilales bacterium]